MSRYDLLYKYSIDSGATWTDITGIINSANTTINHSLCSTQFKSVMDTASFRLPSAPSAKKNALVDAIMTGKTVIVEIYAPGPIQVQWDTSDAKWEDFNVMWEGSTIQFTGYVDKSSFSVKSYPLTAEVTVNVKDVSSLNLDNKVNDHIFWKNKTITQIVKLLLSHAGYLYTSSAIKGAEERTLSAFVVDKDNAKTYREYIDTLLFEAGGYVLDFMEDGKADIVRLNWKDEDANARTIDNPMLAEGVSTSAAYLKEDGVKLKWSTLDTKTNQVVYRDGISRSMGDDGYLLGVDVPNEGYWPSDGYSSPVYQQYSADFLDTAYLRDETIKKNEDLSIIAVENVSAYIQATKNGQKFTAWQYPVTSEDFKFDFDLNPNPTLWPTKAWYLLRNNSGGTVNLQFFTLRGDVIYRNKINETTTPSTSKKPKEYTSDYIFSSAHADAFSQFYWHFMNTSRFISKWSELGEPSKLGDVVMIAHKGTEKGQDAVIVGKTITWIGHVKKVAYTAVGVSEYNAYTAVTSGKVSGSSTSTGATYTPSVDSNGNLSWSNDQGLDNPPTVNIKGEPVVTSAQYYFSSSNTQTKDGEWLDDVDSWSYGKYIWKRNKMVNPSSGAESYGTASYDAELTASYNKKLKWSFSCSSYDFKCDRRNPNVTTTVSFTKDVRYYGDVSEVWKKSNRSSSEQTFVGELSINGYEPEDVIVKMVHPTYPEIYSSVVITRVDVTGDRIKLDPVELITELPTELSDGRKLIKGDYCIVKRVDGGFKPTPYEVFSVSSDGTPTWVKSTDESVFVDTTEEVVALAKEEKDSGADINYVEALYAYQAYITRLSVGVLYVGTMFGNDIQSSNYKEGEAGYKLTASTGTLEAVDAELSGSISVDHAYVSKGVFRQDRFYPEWF